MIFLKITRLMTLALLLAVVGCVEPQGEHDVVISRPGTQRGQAPYAPDPGTENRNEKDRSDNFESVAGRDVGLSEEQFERGRIYVNGWSGERDEIPIGSKWMVRSVGDQPGSGDEGSRDTSPDTSGGGSVTYNGQIRALLTANCTTCHGPGGSRATSPMDTYENARLFGDQIVARVVNGTMPLGGPLGASDKKTFEDWKAAGYPQGGASDTGAGGGQVQGQGTAAVTFTIPGTLVNGGWNTPANPVVVKVGGTLTVVNNTSLEYWLHTTGQPFPHPPNAIRPGSQETYTIRSAFDGALRQHDGTPNQFQFYIRTEN